MTSDRYQIYFSDKVDQILLHDTELDHYIYDCIPDGSPRWYAIGLDHSYYEEQGYVHIGEL